MREREVHAPIELKVSFFFFLLSREARKIKM
jgi:hypothetical protein